MTALLLTHTCTSQCDSCHTAENCVPATRRWLDLLLCADCYADLGLTA